MSEPLLVVDGLDAYYGQAQILEGVSFSMGVEAVALIGRNGPCMAKRIAPHRQRPCRDLG